MTTLIAIGVIAVLAFGIQWSTNRWWLALLVPFILFGFFFWVGHSNSNGDNTLQLWPHILMIALVYLTICMCGILPARALKNRGRNRPVLDARIAPWIATFFAIYGGYSIYVAWTYPAYLLLVGAVISLAAGIGLWFHKTWSQYFAYLTSAGLVAWWVWSGWQAAENGTWKPETLDQLVLTLLPGLPYVAISMAASTVAYRSFHSRSPGVK